MKIDIHPLAMFGLRSPPWWFIRLPPIPASFFWIYRLISYFSGVPLERLTGFNPYGTDSEEEFAESEPSYSPQTKLRQPQELTNLPAPSPASSFRNTPVLASRPVGRVRSRNSISALISSNVSAATGSTRGLETDYDWTESDWTENDVTPRNFDAQNQPIPAAMALSDIDEGSREESSGMSSRGTGSDAHVSALSNAETSQSDAQSDIQAAEQSDAPSSSFRTIPSRALSSSQVESHQTFSSVEESERAGGFQSIGEDSSDAVQSDGLIVVNPELNTRNIKVHTK